jgi:hypothetical protein
MSSGLAVSPLPRSYNKTQRALLDVMIAQSVESSGGPDNVTINQLIGIKEMLENEFTLAAALEDEEPPD